MAKAKYQEDWQVEADRRYREQSRGARFKLPEGDNSIRVLPRLNDDGEFGGAPYEEYYAHGEVGPNKRFTRCGKDVRGDGSCWLCDKILPKLRDSDRKSDRTRAKAMEPTLQFVVQIATYDDDRGEFSGPLLWSVSTGGAKALATRLMGVLRKGPRFFHLKKGYNINIDRTGTGFKDTSYGSPIPDHEPSAVPKSISKKIKKFSDVVRDYDRDYMEAAFRGTEDEENEDRETRRKDSGRKRSKDKGGKKDKARKAAKPAKESSKPKKAKAKAAKPAKKEKAKKKSEAEAKPPKKAKEKKAKAEKPAKSKKAKEPDPAPSKKPKKAGYTSPEFEDLYKDSEKKQAD